jgi:putative endonuclease
METWTVYILTCADGSIYTGCTSNLDARLKRHQDGLVASTKFRRPLSLIVKIVFADKYKAFNFEKYLKSGSGRAFSKRHFQ